MSSDPMSVAGGGQLRAAMGSKQLHVGMAANGWTFTNPETNCLVLGPPRSGKTSSILVPQIITAVGSVVALTTKGSTLYGPTAQTRARTGTLWHYNPSGEGPTLAGCRQARWSPLNGAEHWTTAWRTGSALADTVLKPAEESSSGEFFRRTSRRLISVAIHGAALGGRDIGFVRKVMSGNRSAQSDLESIIFSTGSEYAQEGLEGFGNADPRTRANVFSSAQLCFDAYSFDESVASTRNPNFDPRQFAASEGDTLYITASPDEQELIGPLIVNLLAQIRRARYELWAADDEGQHRGRMPMFWALDELSSLARIDRFPRLVSQSADTGVLISAVCQSLAQTEAVWGAEGKQMMDFFTSVVVFPGVRNSDTLQQIAQLGGKVWIRRVTNSWSHATSSSESFGRGTHGRSYTESYGESNSQSSSETDHLVDRMTPGDVHQGYTGIGSELVRQDRIIYLSGPAVHQLQAMPYYKSSPFREALIANAIYAAQNFFDDRGLIRPPRIAAAGLDDRWRKAYQWALTELAVTRGDTSWSAAHADPHGGRSPGDAVHASISCCGSMSQVDLPPGRHVPAAEQRKAQVEASWKAWNDPVYHEGSDNGDGTFRCQGCSQTLEAGRIRVLPDARFCSNSRKRVAAPRRSQRGWLQKAMCRVFPELADLDRPVGGSSQGDGWAWS